MATWLIHFERWDGFFFRYLENVTKCNAHPYGELEWAYIKQSITVFSHLTWRTKGFKIWDTKQTVKKFSLSKKQNKKILTLRDQCCSTHKTHPPPSHGNRITPKSAGTHVQIRSRKARLLESHIMFKLPWGHLIVGDKQGARSLRAPRRWRWLSKVLVEPRFGRRETKDWLKNKTSQHCLLSQGTVDQTMMMMTSVQHDGTLDLAGWRVAHELAARFARVRRTDDGCDVEKVNEDCTDDEPENRREISNYNTCPVN